MMGLEVKKEQEIENMVSILKQIELPDILLLSRDANTLLMRQKESENIRVKEAIWNIDIIIVMEDTMKLIRTGTQYGLRVRPEFGKEHFGIWQNGIQITEPWKIKIVANNVEIWSMFYLAAKMDRWYNCDGGYVDKIRLFYQSLS